MYQIIYVIKFHWSNCIRKDDNVSSKSYISVNDISGKFTCFLLITFLGILMFYLLLKINIVIS